MNAEDEIKDRVERIYSLDGPGFPEEVVKSFEYASVSDRIVKSCRTPRWWAWCLKPPNVAWW